MNFVDALCYSVQNLDYLVECHTTVWIERRGGERIQPMRNFLGEKSWHLLLSSGCEVYYFTLLFYYFKPSVRIDLGPLGYVSGTLGTLDMSSNRKCSCPIASRLRCWSAFERHSINREWYLGVLQEAGKHASASIDSGTDKTKPHMPEGNRKKPEPATVLILI